MKRIIGRTAFFFQDGDEQLLFLNEKFFPIANLLNRLLNEKYSGTKIKFINIYFSTERTYDIYPASIKNSAHFYGGHLNYKSVFDLEGLIASNGDEQIKLIWDKSFTSLKAAAYAIKNNELSNAVDYTYKKGIEIGIDPNFQLIVRDFIYNGGLLKAALWIKFFNGKMHSSLKLEKSGSVLLELPIDEAKNGIDFFLDMYKEIEIKDDIIIIKGLKDASYLPLKIPIPQMY